MEKTLLILSLLLAACLSRAAADSQTKRALGPFSVGENMAVTFSTGNLQFNAMNGERQCADGTTQTGTWRFAENQWDYIGDDKKNISNSYNGWIDLFAWGTSGWSSGAEEYMPYATNENNSAYYPGGNLIYGLTDAYAYADWGRYNRIGADAPGTWRLLTNEEWLYLLHKRKDAELLFALGTVNGVNGLILLPDNTHIPDSIGFTPSTTKNLEWYNGGFYYLRNGRCYFHNNYTAGQWRQLELLFGAVFLPDAGYRDLTSSLMYVSGFGGSYWESVPANADRAYRLHFSASYVYPQDYQERHMGFSVRLVRDIATGCECRKYQSR